MGNQAMDRFKAGEDSVVVATDVAARGLGVTRTRTVIHYQLPHSAEVMRRAMPRVVCLMML